MTHNHLDDLDPLHASRDARYVFAYLSRRGGSVRLRPLMRKLGMDERAFVTAVIELGERYWIRIVWRNAPPGTPDDEPRPYTDIERLVSTRFGRKKYRSTWPR